MAKDKNPVNSRKSAERPVIPAPAIVGAQEPRADNANSLKSADYHVPEVPTASKRDAPLTNYGPSQTSLPAPDPTMRIRAPYRADLEAEKWRPQRDLVEVPAAPLPDPTEQELLIRERIKAEEAERIRVERAAVRQVTLKVKRRTRWRQVIVLGTLLALLAGGGLFAALALTGVLTISGIGPSSKVPPFMCPGKTFKGLAPSEIEANIYNASGTNGLAGRVANEVGARGVTVKSTKNDPLNGKYPDNAAVIRFGPTALPQAWTLLTMFPNSKLEYVKLKGSSPIVDVVLAPKYAALTPVAAAQSLYKGPIPDYVEIPGCIDPTTAPAANKSATPAATTKAK